MKFAVVAPVVSAPPHSAGSAKSSFSQPTATVSSRVASGEPTQLNAFWSSAVASQSAPSAAGVTPPVTKWKKRGPGGGRRGVEPAEQLLERGDGARALLGQRASEAGGRLLGALGKHRPPVEPGEPGGGVGEGELARPPSRLVDRGQALLSRGGLLRLPTAPPRPAGERTFRISRT